MTLDPDPYVVVVTSNSDLAAALPFHCSLPVEYDVAMAAEAVVVVIDQRPGRSVDEELGRLAGVALECVVVISDEVHGSPVGATITRPVSLSELCQQIDRVASRSRGVLAEPSAPAEVFEVHGVLGSHESPDADVGAPDEVEDLQAVRAPSATRPQPPEVLVAPDEVDDSQDAAREFFREVDRSAHAARVVMALLSRHPTLRDADDLIAAVAEEALQGLSASMLSMWRRGPSAELTLIGGVGLRPADRQRELTALHPLLAAALDEGGVLITSVWDEPARVAGLPGAYCESLVLLPVDIGEDLSVLVVAGGDGFDQTAFSQIEGALLAATALLDWAVALQGLRLTLDV